MRSQLVSLIVSLVAINLPSLSVAHNYIRKKGSVVAEIDGKYLRQHGSIIAEFDGKYLRKAGSIIAGLDGKYIRKNGSIYAEIDGKHIRKMGSIEWTIEDNGDCRRKGSVVYKIDDYTGSEMMKWKVAAFLLFFAE